MYDKLLTIQTKLKAPKNQLNKFGNYRYRSTEDIIEAVKPLLAEEKLTMTISDEIVNLGSRFYVKATVTIFDDTNKEENYDVSTFSVRVTKPSVIAVSAYAREEETKKGMDGAQITGAASSYARKYALNGMFAIDDTKDPDETNTHGKETKSAPLAEDNDTPF